MFEKNKQSKNRKRVTGPSDGPFMCSQRFTVPLPN